MSFLHNVVHHPRRLWLRAALFQLHLWVGILLSVYLILIALSGSVLVYKAELARSTLPSQLTHYNAAHTISPSTVVEQFVLAEPHVLLSNMQVPTTVLPAYLLEGKDARGRAVRWFADPTTGALHHAPRTWLDTVHDLHYYLLLPPAWGMQANAIGAALLLLLALTGAFLWWPGMRSWMRGLRVNLRANWRRLNYDLHNAIGFWTLLLVFWWAISGVYFGFYRQVTTLVSTISPLIGMRSPSPAAYPAPSLIPHATLTDVLHAASAASPNGKLWSLSDPMLRTGESYVLLDRAAPGDFSHRDIVRVRTADARVLSIWHYGERHSFGDWVLWLMHPLHFGTLWGQVVKLLWALAGLALAVLTLTGLLMYWNRFLRHRWHALHFRAPQA